MPQSDLTCPRCDKRLFEIDGVLLCRDCDQEEYERRTRRKR